MGGKGKKLQQKQLKSTTTTSAQRKREERDTKLRLRKEQARQRNYESNEERQFAGELLEKGYVISVVDGDGKCVTNNNCSALKCAD
jgi:hypothetical protein